MKQKIVVIAGPTATGKTRLAVLLAKRFGGEVISADSMQIYRYMDIGSAKPTEEEMDGVPHWMIDTLEPTEPFSVAQYVVQAKKAADDILSRGRLPILAGGTGLYISSFVDNIRFTQSETDFALRNMLLGEAEQKGPQVLYDRLFKVDPQAAEKIHPNNVKRVVRALELYETTGLTLTQQNERSKAEPSPYLPVFLALGADREVLYERINRRVDQMEAAGLIGEVRRLRQMGLTKEMQSMQGIGYKEVFAYLDGEMSREDCLQWIKKNSRNYAKRQLTWFRREERYHWLCCTDEDLDEKAAGLVAKFLSAPDTDV